MKTILILFAIIGFNLGAPSNPRNLTDDLISFLGILPVDEISTIFADHLEQDGTFDVVILYLKGPVWAELLAEIETKQAVLDFLQYLRDDQFPIDLILEAAGALIETSEPGTEPDENGSLRPFFDEIEAALPLQELSDFLNDRLENSPDFQALYVEIASEDARALVAEVRAMEEAQHIEQRLRDFGVKYDEALAAIFEFLGWGTPTV